MSYYADRVFELTYSTGIGNLLLAGSPIGYVTWFAGFGVGVARPYVVEQVATGDWEIGLGTVVDLGGGSYALSRSVVKSSNANALVNFGSGTKNIRASLPAADADLFRNAINAILKDGSVAFTGDQSLGGHKATNAAAPTAGGDLANKTYVDGLVAATLAAVILKDGSIAFTGDQSLGGHKATNAAAPTAGGDLTNKTYVDAGDTAILAAVILKNGSVAFTGDQSLGGHKATNAAAPTAGGDLTNKTYVDAQVAAAGNVRATTPTTVDSVPSWNDTAGTLRPSALVKIHNSSNDKLEYAARYGAYKIATDGATVTLDLDQGNDWEITLGGNRTLAYTHANIDELVTVIWKQDATGGRTPTWWANILWANGVAPVTDTTASTGWNMVRLLCVGVDGYGVPIWYEVSRRGSKLAGSLFHTNAANELVQLDAAGKLPAIDGSQLTNLPGGSYFSGVLHGSGSLTFGSIGGGGGTANQPITVTGAVSGDSVMVCPRANLVGPFAYYAWVSGSNTVQVQIVNAGGIAYTPTVTTWDAWILRP